MTSDPEQRYALGIPSPWSRRREAILLAVLALMAVIGSAGLGLLAGYGHAWGQFLRMQTAAEELAAARDMETVLPRLDRLQELRGVLAGKAEARLLLAQAYMRASSLLPHPRPYEQAAWRELQQARELGGLGLGLRVRLLELESSLLMEAERFEEADNRLEQWEQALRMGGDAIPPQLAAEELSLKNAQAYLYAIADEPPVRNPERAVELAEEVIAEDRVLIGGEYPSGSAAFVDTLAEAHFAAGRPARALEIQQTALALADGDNLAVYLRHYDAYAKAAEQGLRD